MFKLGNFTLHSGDKSRYLIDCKSMTPDDWEAVAYMAQERLPNFGSVIGIPTGGLMFAAAMQKYCTSGPRLIVDDVYTTGSSFKPYENTPDIACVLYARNPTPQWIRVIFNMSPPLS